MPERIPQSVAIRVPLQAYLSSDGKTPATGKTIAVQISKNGGAYADPSGGAMNATEIGHGSYYADLSTTDVGTAGPWFVRGTNADIDDVVVIYNVVNAHNAGFDGVPSAAVNATGGLLAQVIRSGTAQAGANNAITLDSGASATNTFYRGSWIVVVGGTGAGQARFIAGYVGSTKVATTVVAWVTNPDATSVFAIIPAAGVDVEFWLGQAPIAVNTAGVPQVDVNLIAGSATAATNQKNAALGVYVGAATGTPTTTTMADSAQTGGDNGWWNGAVITFITGACAGQRTAITAYNASTKVYTFTALTRAPSAADVYTIS